MSQDKKKVQTLINRAGDAMVEVRAAVAVINDYTGRFVAAAPDVTGTPLEGNTAKLNRALVALTAEVDKAIWTALITANDPWHDGDAL